MIRSIFFDFDGVIVESVRIKTDAFAGLFAHEGSSVAKKVVDYHIRNTGVSRFDKFAYIYKEILKRPLGDREFEALCARFAEMVKDLVVKAPYVEGAGEFLKNNSSRYGIFVVSATPQAEIEEIIAKRGMRDFFKSIYGAPVKKKDAVKEALGCEGISPADAVYIGDAMSDYAAARDNGVRFIARVRDDDAVFDGVDCVKIKDLKGLEAVIDSLNRGN